GSPATSVPGMGLHPPGPPLARPILPRERGALDRIVEYLVGDGPQNSFSMCLLFFLEPCKKNQTSGSKTS
ncbi:lunapark, ER junction formation factor, partial [Homo sapiens]